MADVFISYKAEDRRRIQPLVDALEADGFSIWWDAHLGAGVEWRDRIAAELESAKCVVVAWSRQSVAPEGRFVRDEASRALRRGVYIPINIDPVEPPLGFGETQALPLIGWKGRRSDAAYQVLRTAVAAMVRGDRGASVGADPPPRSRRAVLAAGAASVVALAGGAAWLWAGKERLSPEAQRLVDDAREGVANGAVEDNTNALSKLRKASELERESGLVWGLLALAYVQQSRAAAGSDREQLVARGLSAAKRAKSLVEDQPDATAAEILSMPEYRNWLAVDQACRRALAKHPDHPFLLMCFAGLLFQVGRQEEALKHVDQLLEQLSQPRFHVLRTTLLWDLGRLDEAEAELDRAFNLWPRFYQVWFSRYYFLVYNGRAQEALALMKDRAGRPVGIPEWNFALVQSEGEAIASGNGALIETALQRLKAAARQAAGFAGNAAIFAAFFGRTDTAFEILTGLYTNRGFSVADTWFSQEQAIYLGRERHTYILFRRQLTNLRRDPRYRALAREIGLEDYWNRSGSIDRVTF